MFKHKFYTTLLLIGVLTLAACGNDEPDTPGNGNDNGNDIEVPTPTPDKQEQNEVTVYADESTSTGVPFRRIDDTTFWLNHIKYSIVEGHLEVVDHDCIELEHSLNGEVNICSAITIDGVKYRVEVFRDWGGCKNLKRIKIPDSVYSFPNPWKQLSGEPYFDSDLGVFHDCVNLESIELSRWMSEIPVYFLYGCKSLKELVTAAYGINEGCFMNCSSLKKLTLECSTVQFRGRNQFTGVNGLKLIQFGEVYCITSNNHYGIPDRRSSHDLYVKIKEPEKLVFCLKDLHSNYGFYASLSYSYCSERDDKLDIVFKPFDKVFVPQASLEAYQKYYLPLDKDKFVGYDPETFDFDSLIE